MILDKATIELLKQLIPAISLLVGASIPIFGTWLNNRHTRQLQRDQWEREDQKAQKETQKLEAQKALEQERQAYQAIIDNYANAIGHLSVIANSEADPLHPANISALQEVQPYLLQILLTYPDTENYYYQSATVCIDGLNSDIEKTFAVAKDLRRHILDLANNDPRLKE